MVGLLDNTLDDRVFPALCMFSMIIVLIHVYPWPARRLDHIPAVGPVSQIFSFVGALQFVFDAKAIIQRGCEQYSSKGIFRVPTLDRWLVVIVNPDLIREAGKVPEDVLSAGAAAVDIFHLDVILGPTAITDPYHQPFIRTDLIRILRTAFPVFHKEVRDAFDDFIPAGRNGWLKLRATEIIAPIISRATNVVFVGPTLCRDADFIDLTVAFSAEAVKMGLILHFTPPSLRQFVANWFVGLPALIARSIKHLQPLMRERRRLLSESNSDKPNDFLTLLMEHKEESDDELARRILSLNLLAMHATETTFFHAVYRLAASPEHAEVLREEVNEVIRQEGWTYAAIGKMIKVDSFIKESMRIDAEALILRRTVLQSYTLSDGTFLPQGTHISAPAHSIQTNELNYSNPLVFEPFRYLDKTRKENIGRKVEMTVPHIDFLPWGIGLHICSGRFFATNILKLMLAILVTTYDVALEDTIQQRPRSFGTMSLPNPSAKLLFRRRGLNV
ncbi:hypothetical protein APHAL10511_004167 [Amanita phalloides]|nr:hypothetical protein APHAL10511_004167 [Amanita phalloides]